MEREFRGFARVDTLDTDTVPAQSGIGTFTLDPGDGRRRVRAAAGVDAHLVSHRRLLRPRRHRRAPGRASTTRATRKAPRLATTILPSATSAEELREACRALRGRVLREEVYAQDGTPAAVNPYTTREHRYQVDLLQPASASSYGSFYAVGARDRRLPLRARPRRPARRARSDAGDRRLRKRDHAKRPSAIRGAHRHTPSRARPGSATAKHDFTNVAGRSRTGTGSGLPVETRDYQLTGVAAGSERTV